MLLLRRAGEDADGVRAMVSDPAFSDTLVGFHAQQAVEKLIKSILADREIRYPFTHDIALLIDLARRAGIEVDFAVDEAIDLTGWGVSFRYSDDLDEALDRNAALAVVQSVEAWAERLLR